MFRLLAEAEGGERDTWESTQPVGTERATIGPTRITLRCQVGILKGERPEHPNLLAAAAELFNVCGHHPSLGSSVSLANSVRERSRSAREQSNANRGDM